MLKQLEITKQTAKELMAKNNPIVIPRNHHVEAVLSRCEQVIFDNTEQSLIDEKECISDIVEEFLHVLRSPYQELETTKNYQDNPKDKDQYYQTFCGT
jgi:uncharacterized protein YdiU (UPF0061 family)